MNLFVISLDLSFSHYCILEHRFTNKIHLHDCLTRQVE